MISSVLCVCARREREARSIIFQIIVISCKQNAYHFSVERRGHAKKLKRGEKKKKEGKEKKKLFNREAGAQGPNRGC